MQLSLFEFITLEATYEHGKTRHIYDAVGRKIGLTQKDMTERVQRGQFFVGKWQHKIRWIQQDLKAKGLIHSQKRGSWALTAKGRQALSFAPNNQATLYFVTKSGVSFWGDSSVASSLFPGEIELIITSPPYLLTNEREYRNIAKTESCYVVGMLHSMESLLKCLTPTGSVVLNIGDSIKKGTGYQSLYKERLLIGLEDKLGLHLVQTFVWYSPTKMPSGFWVTQAKRDCVQATENFYLLSLNPKNKKNINQKIKVDYSESQKKYIKNAKRKSPIKRRMPSGQIANEETFYKDGGGAIPSNLLFANPEPPNSSYSQYCRAQGLPRHPAMFNPELSSFFIEYLTNRGDVVLDPYAGSGSVSYSAESLGRHWVNFEVVEEYVGGQMGRFDNPITVNFLTQGEYANG